MKNKLIPVLLTIAVLGGCTSKSGDLKKGTIIDFTAPTCVITPGATNNSGPMNLTIPPSGNYVTVSAFFTGSSPNTTVTVAGAGGGGALLSSQFNKWCSLKLPSPAVQQSFTITVNNPAKNYDTVFTSPGQANVNELYGVNTSIYTHKTGGDSVIVVVQDSAVVAP